MPSQIFQSTSDSKKDLRKSKPQSPTNNPLDFFRERGGFVIESDHGWLNYYIMSTGVGYLENMHIYPESRMKQNGTYLLSIFEMELKEIRGVNFYYTTINRKFGDTDRTLQICLKRGFSFAASDEISITLKKEI